MSLKGVKEISKQCLDSAEGKVKSIEEALRLISQGKSVKEIKTLTGLSEREIMEMKGDY